ncbi:MAG: hypothetical protein ACPLRH_00610 [Desulfotomaculales bacterium]
MEIKGKYRNGKGSFYDAAKKERIFTEFKEMLLKMDPGVISELTREYLVFMCGLRGDSIKQFKKKYEGPAFLEIVKRFDRNHPEYYAKRYNLIHSLDNSRRYDLHRDMINLATSLAPKIYAQILGGSPDDYDVEKKRLQEKIEGLRRTAERYGYILVKKSLTQPDGSECVVYPV